MARRTRIRNGGERVTFAPGHRPSPEALAEFIEYLIPEARQISETVAFLLELALSELSKQIARDGEDGGADGPAGPPEKYS
jgi:hypothetical protein